MFRQTPDQTFPRSCRLTKTDEFSSVFGFRKAIKSAHFLLHYRPREEKEPRFGVVVAKRLLRRSVDRNRVRRVARERFRRIRTKLMPRDLVLRLVLRPETLDKKGIGEEIEALLKKCGLRAD